MIASALPDRIIAEGTTLRIEVNDPDGDTVTLSASSACDDLRVEMDANLLTLTPLGTDIFCRISLQAESRDGVSSKTFDVLCLGEMIYLGTRYDIGGRFADADEVDEYRAYLGGDVEISGTRGYGNQAFFIWVMDQNGNIAIAPDDDAVSGTLSPGIYTIAASLSSGSWYYPYEEAYSGYGLSVAADDLTYTVSDLAASLGIGLSTGEDDLVPTSKQFLESIYVAYWRRAADPDGLYYWIGLYDTGVLDFAGIAENFASSNEGTAAYAYFDTVFNHSGDSVTDGMREDFIEAVYQNLFDRPPDEAGLAYWAEILESGGTTPGAFIAAIVNAAYEGRQGASADDWSNIDAKIQVAEYYTDGIDALGFTWTDDRLQQARDVLVGVDRNSDIDAMKQAIDDELGNP